MTCGYCQEIGHTKTVCQTLKTVSQQLSVETTTEELMSFSANQAKMLLEQYLKNSPLLEYKKRQILRSKKKEIQNYLIAVYVHKTEIDIPHNENAVAENPFIQNREEELILLEPKIRELTALLNQRPVSQYRDIPSFVQLFKVVLKEKEECAVCWENKTDCKTNCCHPFCLTCITKVLNDTACCPTCRGKLDTLYISA
jgi:hypothetical protein